MALLRDTLFVDGLDVLDFESSETWPESPDELPVVGSGLGGRVKLS